MRDVGILMGINSLPSKYGIGDFGSEAYRFVDMLSNNNNRYWQILPFNRLGYGNSPYQTYSSVAGDEIFISLDKLVAQKLLDINDLINFNDNSNCIDYVEVRKFKTSMLKKAFSNFKVDFNLFKNDYESFVKESKWLEAYCVFASFKEYNNLLCWNEWPYEYKNWIKDRDLSLRKKHQDEIEYYYFVQYIFYQQWFELKRYANSCNVEIIGDIPYYVGIDSVDVWENEQCFLLDNDGKPTYIAGVPPDYFSKIGQRWGNPIYNWEFIKGDNFKFWINRLELIKNTFDIIRIDHFRAFDTYWKIPSDCPTAIEGEWIEAPGYEFFDTLYKKNPTIKLIAEDLGDLRLEVFDLRDHYHLMGMEVIQFAFNLAKKIKIDDYRNVILYTGTHDNQTIVGWFESQEKNVQKEIIAFLQKEGYTGAINEMMIKYALSFNVNVCMIPIQDILGLNDEARINVPGTVGSPNWEWKLKDFNQLEIEILKYK